MSCPAAVFKLFRPKTVAPESASLQESSAELRGTTTEGYHYALRLQRDAQGAAQRVIGWHGTSKGGARVEMQRGPDGVWRDLRGHSATSAEALIPLPIRHSAGWATQWNVATRSGDSPTAAERAGPAAAPSVLDLP